MATTRMHIKSATYMKEFLIKNRKDFSIERTSTGYPTVHYNNIAYYVRDKIMQRSFLNKIINFQTDIKNSKIYKYVDELELEQIEKSTFDIERSLMYKGFTINPKIEPIIEKVVKIDLNTAYWQTCKALKCIKAKTHKDIVDNCVKGTRLKITGTLGRKVYVTDYVDGKKKNTYIKPMPKKRIVFQNIYNRLRKYVDELMIYCWAINPDNFIGFYVDCLWLKEYDPNIIEMIRQIYDVKMELVDLRLEINNHGKMNIIEVAVDGGAMTRYDGTYKPQEFAIYKNLYNFTLDLKKTKTDIIW
jgi:hypothetical protein